MRILLTMTNDGFGGAEFYARDFLRALRLAGHDVHVFIAGDRPMLRDEMREHGLEVTLSGTALRVSRPLTGLLNGLSLRRIASAWRPDIVIDNLPRSVLLSSVFLPFARHIALLHGPLRADRISRAARPLIRRLLANTVETADAVQLALRRTVETRVVFPTATALTRSEGTVAEQRRDTVTMIGRWQPYKGHADFVRLASQIHASHPNMQFCMIGSIADEEQRAHHARVVALIQELGLTDAVEVMVDAPKSTIDSVLERTRVYAHMAQSEDFGISILEALLAGCGAVAYAAQGPRILLTDTRAARLVDIGDLQAFVDMTRRLLDDTNAEDLSRLAREHGSLFAFNDRYVSICDAAIRELCGRT